jgi:hypothetical protein
VTGYLGKDGLERPSFNSEGSSKMEILIPLGVLVVWFLLQVWILPKFGVST